jgi:hypothetical protein
MKPHSSLKVGIFCLLSFGALSSFSWTALANLGDAASSETVSGSTDTETDALAPVSSTEVNTGQDDDHYYETVEVADESGIRSYRKKKVPADWPKARACNNIYAAVKAAVGGNTNRANCYMGLFFMETTCNPNTSQAAGNAGNAHAAYGVCSLEKSSTVRRNNHRGPDCNNIQGITNQTKCCRAIMRKTPNYFGPYNRREVPQCG